MVPQPAWERLPEVEVRGAAGLLRKQVHRGAVCLRGQAHEERLQADLVVQARGPPPRGGLATQAGLAGSHQGVHAAVHLWVAPISAVLQVGPVAAVLDHLRRPAAHQEVPAHRLLRGVLEAGLPGVHPFLVARPCLEVHLLEEAL